MWIESEIDNWMREQVADGVAPGGFIRELIAEQGDMTLIEVQARLIERGAPVGIGTVQRFFVRHGITRKKDRPRG